MQDKNMNTIKMVLIRVQRSGQKIMRDLIRTQICIFISESASVTGFLSMEMINTGSGSHSQACISVPLLN